MDRKTLAATMLKTSIWTFVEGNKTDRYRLGVDPGKDFGGTNGGVTFVPGLYPLLWLILGAFGLLPNLWFLFLVIHGPSRARGKTGATPENSS